MGDLKITWEVDDGYVGKSRPQFAIIPEDELEGYDDPEEREEFINEWVQDEFEMSIGWSITNTEEL